MHIVLCFGGGMENPAYPDAFLLQSGGGGDGDADGNGGGDGKASWKRVASMKEARNWYSHNTVTTHNNTITMSNAPRSAQRA